MKFGKWNESVHESADQLKRMNTMRSIKSQDVVVDTVNKRATITSKHGTYDVFLDECTCTDFCVRQLPCKHIYRLAFELGYIDLPKIDKEAQKAFEATVPAEIERFKKLYLNGSISGDKFSKIISALQSK